MTDQPKPHHPGPDNASHRNPLEGRGDANESAGRLRCSEFSPVDLERAADLLAATPQPTRDAAEGAGGCDDLGIVLSALRFMEDAVGEKFDDEEGVIAQIERDHAAGLSAIVTSQPAPDAMREAIRKAMLHLSRSGFTMNSGEAFEYITNAVATAAALAAPVPSPDGARWRHRKRGTTYTEIGRGNLQIATDPVAEDDRVVIYRSEVDGRIWVRGEAEFQDGRFEAIAPSGSTGAAEPGAHIDLLQESKNLTAILEYMESTNARQFDPKYVVTLIALVRNRLAATPPVRGDREAAHKTIYKHLYQALEKTGLSETFLTRELWQATKLAADDLTTVPASTPVRSS